MLATHFDTDAQWLTELPTRFALDPAAEALRAFGLTVTRGSDRISQQAVERLIISILEHNETPLRGPNPLLVLLAEERTGGSVVSRYRTLIVEALERLPYEMGSRDPRIVLLLLAANAITAETAANQVEKVAKTLITLESLLDHGSMTVKTLSYVIAAVTAFGTTALPSGILDDARIEALVAQMYSSCRRYDIVTVATILRTLSYAGVAPGMLTDISAFLALQRRSTGGFGFLDPLMKNETHRDELWEEVEFRLPISIAAFWALEAYASMQDRVASQECRKAVARTAS